MNGRPAGGQLHRGRQAALDDREVAGRQVAVEVVHVAADLEPVGARQRAGSIRGPATTIIRRSGTRRWASGKRVDHPPQQRARRRPSRRR